MSEEMVDRVEAAIAEAERIGRNRAVAAIKALRNPTGSMVVASRYPNGGPIVEQYRRMIDDAAK